MKRQTVLCSLFFFHLFCCLFITAHAQTKGQVLATGMIAAGKIVEKLGNDPVATVRQINKALDFDLHQMVSEMGKGAQEIRNFIDDRHRVIAQHEWKNRWENEFNRAQAFEMFRNVGRGRGFDNQFGFPLGFR